MRKTGSGRNSKSQTKSGAVKQAAVPRRATSPKSDEVKSAELQVPIAAVALGLLDKSRSECVVYLAADERRAETIGRLLRRLAPATETLVFPPWDCLPFDRASPSRDSMGRRMAVVQSIAAKPDARRIVVSTIEATFQRLPPLGAIAEARFDLCTGEPVDEAALRNFGERTGYQLSERVQEPGDIQFHGRVVEVFPPGAALPLRIDVGDGRVAEISTFDPVGQRSVAILDTAAIGPASEILIPTGAECPERSSGAEHRLPDFYEAPLTTLFDLLPDALLALAPETDTRRQAYHEQLAEDHDARSTLPGERGSSGRLLAPDRVFLTDPEWVAIRSGRAECNIESRDIRPTPDFATASKPVHEFQAYLEQAIAEDTTVVLAGVARDITAFGRFLERHGGAKPEAVLDWDTVRAGKPGSFFSLDLDLDEGVFDEADGIALVAAADVLGTRVHRESRRDFGGSVLSAEPPMRVGDTVIHEDHGIGVLRGLEDVEIEGRLQEAARLEYHGGASLLTLAADFDRVWRYGSDDDAVSPDRLHTEAWAKRRIEVEIAVRSVAERLVEMARERAGIEAPELVPPRRDYERFSARFPFPETPHQSRGIAAVMADLASGHPMDRLVCGDVGFGKTEIALRAAAAAVFAGKQVAVVAPTTVLARQHLQTFRKRFAPFGIEVAGLSRLVASPEAKRVKAGLADGSVGIVVGTQAIAAADVTFADLGLLIIDEEHKFGATLKAELRDRAATGHVLTLTATPIPRTLQMAMLGIQTVSVLATPPVRRRPIRTFAMPFDAASVRIALRREQARGGQSFVVVPRVADIEPMREKLAAAAPELSVGVAHGSLPAEAVDQAMIDFADGRGDVLLATNIIESGLDVPRANTILICHADLFGVAQLHQLRGRVGRGRMQGIAYLMTDPESEISEAAQARLATLTQFDRLGAGLSISARDLDLRGAGDLVGDEQAGHMRLIGLGLYQTLLGRAVRLAKGEPVRDEAPPELHLEIAGRIPADYVGEADIRIELYGRLARLDDADSIGAFAEEVEDRFGEPPEAVESLFALARLRALCRSLHIAILSAGPRAIALTFRPEGLPRAHALAEAQPAATLKGSKLVWERATSADAARLGAVEELLHEMAGLELKPEQPE